MKDISVIKKDPSLTQARDFTASQLDLIRRTIAKDTNSEEFNMFIEICRRQGLDPFRRQIYALVFNKDKPTKRQVTFITGIDGYRAIAKRTGTFRPAEKEPEIEYDQSLICPDSNPLGIVKCIYTVFQLSPDGKWYPVVGVARWKEFAPIEPSSYDYIDTGEEWPDGKPKKRKIPKEGAKMTLAKENWKTMPEVMISKCAEAQAIRKGWPEDVGGLYVEEEIDFSKLKDLTAEQEIEEFKQQERIRLTKSDNYIPMIMAQTVGIEPVAIGQLADSILDLLNTFEDAQEIDFFMDRNKYGLQTFWSLKPNDALDLKKEIEKIRAKKVNITKDVTK